MDQQILPRNPLGDTYQWFAKAVPVPQSHNVSVQIGVHFEEVAEMLNEIKSEDDTLAIRLDAAQDALISLANYLKQHRPELVIENRIAFIDAIADQFVTGVGSAYMLGMDPVGALIEVNDSNYSKFVDGLPVFDANKKIQKGPNYRKPDLSRFV